MSYLVVTLVSAIIGGAVTHFFNSIASRREEKTRILRQFINELKDLRETARDYWVNTPQDPSDGVRKTEINYIFQRLPSRFEALRTVYGERRFSLFFELKFRAMHEGITGGAFATVNREFGPEVSLAKIDVIGQLIDCLESEIDIVRAINPLKKHKLL